MTPLDTLPAAAQGAVIAAVISSVISSVVTTIGIFFTNRSAAKRQSDQLTHDRQERHTERLSTLRRALYSEAVVEWQKLNTYLTTLPRMDIANTNVADGFQSFFSVVTRVALVAEPGTAVAVTKLSQSYNELFSTLVEQLLQVSLAKYEADTAKARSDAALKAVEAKTAEVERLRQQEGAKASRILIAQSELHSRLDAMQAAGDESEKKLNAFNVMAFDFSSLVLEHVAKLQPEFVTCLRALRHDLGVPGDLKELDLLADESVRKSRTQLEQMRRTLVAPQETKRIHV